MIIVPFNMDHLSLIKDPTEDDIDGLRREAIRSMSDGMPAFTMLEGFAVVMCWGIHLDHPGVGTAWSVISKKGFCTNLGQHVKAFRRSIYTIASAMRLHRLQALGRASDKALPRWFKFIGAAREAVLEKYGPDKEDYIMYRIIF